MERVEPEDPREREKTPEQGHTEKEPTPKKNGSLTLTRKEGESVVLTTPGGETIVVTVVEIRPHQVRVTFGAPRSVQITRTELLLGEHNRSALRQPGQTPPSLD